MSRRVDTPLPDLPVVDCPVAPDRYNDENAKDESDVPPWTTFPGADELAKRIAYRRAFRAATAYQPGDVVFIEIDGKPIRARVLHVFDERTLAGDLRAKYRVQLETKAGFWSKTFLYTYPGPIQRGYRLAAPPKLTPETEPAVAHLNNALQILQAVAFISEDRKKENVGDIRLTRGEFDSIVARIEKAKAKL